MNIMFAVMQRAILTE